MEQLNFKFFHSRQTFKFVLKTVLILGHLFINCCHFFFLNQMFSITSSREDLIKTSLLVHLMLVYLWERIDHKQEFRISSKRNRKFKLNRFNVLNNCNLQSVSKQCDPSSQTKQKIPLTQQNKCHTVWVYIASCIDGCYMFELNNTSSGWRSQNDVW